MNPGAMINTLFSFEGRLNRLAYCGYSLLSIVAVKAGAVAVGRAASADLIGGGTGQGSYASLLLRILTVTGSWVALALTTKRLHDMDRSGKLLLWMSGIVALYPAPEGLTLGA